MQQVDCIKIVFFDGFICTETDSLLPTIASPVVFTDPRRGCQAGHQRVKVLSRLAVSMSRPMTMPPKRCDRGICELCVSAVDTVTQDLDNQIQPDNASRWQLAFKAKSFDRLQMTPSDIPCRRLISATSGWMIFGTHTMSLMRRTGLTDLGGC